MSVPPIIAPCPVKCFLIKPNGTRAWYLRKYINSTSAKCPAIPGEYSYCDAKSYIGDYSDKDDSNRSELFAGDPRWPSACEHCKRLFSEIRAKTEEQVFTDTIMLNDKGERKTLREWQKIPGAMWDVEYYHDAPMWCGPDGLALHVVCPDGEIWHLDGMCSNCTDRDGAIKGRHKCWPRKGTPPVIDVRKEYGPTCKAGAGSIQTHYWHGFLRNGLLVLN